MFEVNNKIIEKLSKKYDVDFGRMTLTETKEILTLHEYVVFMLSLKYPNDPFREIVKLAKEEERKERLKADVVSIRDGQA